MGRFVIRHGWENSQGNSSTGSQDGHNTLRLPNSLSGGNRTARAGRAKDEGKARAGTRDVWFMEQEGNVNLEVI